MKKRIVAFLCVFFAILHLFACSSKNAPIKDSDALRIVVTIFPAYDWVREILGEQLPHTDLTLLLDHGIDLHSYQPTVDDLVKISTCDMFIYVGGASDDWVDDALSEAINKDMVVINLLETLGDAVKEEELIEGMEAEDEMDDETTEYDEHVWLSLKNAKVLCRAIADKISELDKMHRKVFLSNAEAYINSLDTLDEAYREATDKAACHTLLFGDRFPFRYLVDDYNLSYYAAFAGCSAETEASFKTIVFLAGKVDELQLTAIMQTESADSSVAETIRQNTKTKNQTILTMDSMQSTTMADADNGVTYQSVMQNNLEALKEALN